MFSYHEVYLFIMGVLYGLLIDYVDFFEITAVAAPERLINRVHLSPSVAEQAVTEIKWLN